MRSGQRLALDRPPRLEPFASGGERAHARLEAVRGDEHRVEGEQVREFGLVGLGLVPGRPHRGLLIRRVLEFDQAQRKTVDEQHDIRPALVFALDDGELVDRQPIVVRWVPVVEDGDMWPRRDTVGCPVLDRHAIHKQAVKDSVAGFQSRAFGAGDLAERVVQSLSGQTRVQPVQGVAQPFFQHDFGVVRPFRVFCVRPNVWTVSHPPSKSFEPFERGGFDLRLGKRTRRGCHETDSASLSAPGTRIAPDMSLGRRVSRRPARGRDSCCNPY